MKGKVNGNEVGAKHVREYFCFGVFNVFCVTILLLKHISILISLPKK